MGEAVAESLEVLTRRRGMGELDPGLGAFESVVFTIRDIETWSRGVDTKTQGLTKTNE